MVWGSFPWLWPCPRLIVEYYFQNKWWSESGGDSKKSKKLSASDILAKIFLNRDGKSRSRSRFEVDIDFQVKAGVLVVKNRFLSYRENTYTSKGSAKIFSAVFLNLATKVGDRGYSS